MTDSGNGTTIDVPNHGTPKAPNAYVLCYLTCPQDSSGAFVGALLLTDARGRPLHFGYVTPIKPTPFQRILYGTALLEHVKVDVIAKKLFGGVPQVPDVVFVDSKDLLKSRRFISFPMAHLGKAEGGNESGGQLSALIYDTGENTHDRETVGILINCLENQIDMLEPFRRMTEALKECLKPGGR